MVEKKVFIVLSLLSIFVLSGCDVYNALYAKQPGLEEGSQIVSEEEIVSESELDELNNSLNESDEVSAEIPIGVEEETTPSDATVIIAQETERVSLQPQAQDPDNDQLSFSYTNPLDESGQWQTTYGDAGEYTVTVTASDGTLTASKQALIIVRRKEESPIISNKVPDTTSISIKETQSADFAIVASDLNKDALTYNWKLDGQDVGNEESYDLTTTYNDAGSHTIKVSVTDGTSAAEVIWALTVDNVNRAPKLEPIENVDARETDTIVLELSATDEDGDPIAFNVSDPRFKQENNVFTWQTDYGSAGQYTITIDASDGTDTATQNVAVNVANVNRPPVILDIVRQ